MEAKIVILTTLFLFNCLMFKHWGNWKVTLLSVIGNYFLIIILVESYIALPDFIELFNAILIIVISIVSFYILWRKNKVGLLTGYEKRGFILAVTFLVFFIIMGLLLVLIFLFMEYIY